MKPVVVDPTKPNSHIIALTKYKQSGTLLDLGAGHGRHAIYFAQQGFDVTAVEPDPELCRVIEQKIEATNLKINLVQSDIESFQPEFTYDAVVCAMVLHFLEQKEVMSAITKMQTLTNRQGLNVISAYTDQNDADFMKDNPYGREHYLLKPNELKEPYSDWEILEYSEDWTEPGVVNVGDIPARFHKVNMIARRS